MRTPILSLALALAACGASAPAGKAVRPVRLAAPESSACAGAARFTGNVEPSVRVDLAFKRGGYVGEILKVRDGGKERLVEQGDRVAEGTALMRLRDADYRVKLEQARAQLAQARAARDQARQDYARAKQLLASGSVPQALFDGAEAKARATAGQAQAATAQIEEAQLALDDCTLRAPLDAVVLKRLQEVGSLVGPGSGAFVLADTRTMKVVFGAPDAMLDRLKIGATLDVSVESLGEKPREGTVSRVSPFADAKSRLFEIEVALPNADDRLRAGMIAALRVPEADARAALAVPLRSVVRPPGATQGFAVFVAEAQGGAATLHARAVEPGELCGGQVEITRGLSPGERVVADGAAQAFDGERVTVLQ